ncbi:hypothetical protein CVT25_003901 [Psilocybe cyanescens]|uniref:Uncharacterized protein n=1 Tax=Psilocybe cyanescens TaxID=93625 RepID=A0A409XPY9_PSICY|nr:hypothetical protein CVT25_003901 [Psilocybe cyanescens]
MSVEIETPASVPRQNDPVLQTTAATNLVNPVDGPIIRFPPFPQAPEGVQIMPFKDFEEGGICMDPGPNDAEVDTFGVPTVPLRPQHSTDVCKTNTKRKRRAEEMQARKKGGLGAKKLLWWEEWQEREVARVSVGFDSHSTRFERIHAAAADFTSGRSWPLDFESESGPRFIWEKFQRYIGVSDGSPAPSGKKSKVFKEQAAAEQEEEEMSDVEDPDEETPEDPMAGIVLDKALPAAVKTQAQLAEKEDKLLAFFESPEKSIRIFLTSYGRVMGYIWSEPNLECMGRVLEFFVNYLLRSKVVPEIERSLRRSLDILAVSIKELPNTSALAKVNPDPFSQACTNCWGRKSEGYSIVELDLSHLPQNPPNVPTASKVEEVSNETESKENNASGWGDNSGWASGNAESGGGWGEGTIDASTDLNAWGEPSTIEEQISQWDVLKPKTLLELLGPTALPLTHTTGIVEQSIRRIKSIIPPPANPAKSAPLGEGIFDPDVDAVENDLDRQFAKVILEPMLDWDGGDYPVYARPTILETSVGAVADPNAPEAAEGTPKAYDPYKDEITLLVVPTPGNIALMSEGMGLGGVWVQIVRQDNAVVKKKKKGKSKSKRTIPSYWYLEELAMTTPSFWAV